MAKRTAYRGIIRDDRLTFAVEEEGGRFLWALEENGAALRFYGKHGFVPTGERERAEDFDAWVLKLVWNKGQEEIQDEV